MITLLLVIAAPASAFGQDSTRSVFPGLGLGLAIQSDTRDDHLSRFGPILTGHIAWLPHPRLGGRLVAGLARFPGASGHVHEPCPPDRDPFGCHPPVGAVTVGSASAHFLLFGDDTPDGRPGGYYALGGSLHTAVEHPEERGAVRPAWSVAAGATLGRSREGAALEVRYERSAGWTGGRWSVVMLAVNLSW